MTVTEVTAESAQTKVAAMMNKVAFHKRQSKRHRRLAQEAAQELEAYQREVAERLGFEVVIVPLAHSQEAQSNVRRNQAST